MNTYKKFCPNVFVAQCEEKHQKGSIITLTTKYGKENECIVHNLIKETSSHFYYSITRVDGFNSQERAKNKAKKLKSWANSASKKSNDYYEASNEGKDFLSLGEPIKVGHHSEKRHRALIQRNCNRMDKSVEFSKKAEDHESKAEYWESRSNEINLSMPESIDYYSFALDKAKKRHTGLKDGSIERDHSFSLSYAKKRVNELTKKLNVAKKLWS